MVAGIDTAEEFGAVIDDYTAKLAAETIATDENPAIQSLALTGQVAVDTLLVETRGAIAGEDATATSKACRALRTYAIRIGDRQAVPGWRELEDTGPPAPPGYMGTYACIEAFVCDIGFRVIVLTDGRVQVFQNPQDW